MKQVIERIHAGLARSGDWLLPSLARLVFAAVLAGYFWASAATKFDGGPFSLSTGAYAQIFPKAFDALGYDASRLSLLQHLIALAGAWAEMVLPLLLVIGALTRHAALAMVGFVVVQSLTDIFGHMADAVTLGAWFDRMPDALILDQRALWLVLLAVLIFKGAGPLSVDRLLGQWVARQWASG
jgi:putative oxidoreductase